MNQRARKNQLHEPTPQTLEAGQPLAPEVRALLEPRFSHNFSDVRVHADGQADALARAERAHAFAYGNDLFFRHGAYDPSSSRGLQTLAHELTHVVQQHGATQRNPRSGQRGDANELEARIELEAHRAAGAIMAGGQASVQAGSAQGTSVARLDEDTEAQMAAVAPMLPPPMPGAPMPQIPGPGRVPTNIPGLPQTSPGPGPGGPVGLLGGMGAGIAGALAGVAAFLWPNKTAPRWMDEMNPLNGKPYSSEQEFQAVQQELRQRAQSEAPPAS